MSQVKLRQIGTQLKRMPTHIRKMQILRSVCSTESSYLHSRNNSHRSRRKEEELSNTNDDGFDIVEGTIIVSVVENRAREICITKYDTSNVRYYQLFIEPSSFLTIMSYCHLIIPQGSVVEIYLMADSHSYNEALSTLRNLSPDEVLISTTPSSHQHHSFFTENHNNFIWH